MRLAGRQGGPLEGPPGRHGVPRAAARAHWLRHRGLLPIRTDARMARTVRDTGAMGICFHLLPPLALLPCTCLHRPAHASPHLEPSPPALVPRQDLLWRQRRLGVPAAPAYLHGTGAADGRPQWRGRPVREADIPRGEVQDQSEEGDPQPDLEPDARHRLRPAGLDARRSASPSLVQPCAVVHSRAL